MSTTVLAITKVPLKFKFHNLVKVLSAVIRGHFEPINFKQTPKKPGQKPGKIFYIRLGPNIVVARVIDAINNNTTFRAYVPKDVPNLKQAPQAGKGKGRKGGPKSNAPPAINLLMWTLEEILAEMQAKFTGLYNLAKKTNFELMKDIAWAVFNRLKTLGDNNEELLVSGFKLSGAYRKSYPHSGDFQLILSCLYKLQDKAGVPRAHIVEADLCRVSSQPFVCENVPMDKVQSVCAKYSDRIVKKIEEHVESLEADVSSGNADEDAARKKVRQQLKRLKPYMSKIVREVILNHFIPQKAPYHKVRIYGEPYLPNRDEMFAITKRCGAVSITRSDRLFNLLKLSIPLSQYQALFSQNGKMLGGAKLYIRSSLMPLYKIPAQIKKAMKRQLGYVGESDEEEEVKEDDLEDVDMDIADVEDY